MSTTDVSVGRLRERVTGRVIEPGDADYDAARTVFYGGVDGRPAAILRVADAADVARVVTFAAETGSELAVRSGGHSTAGYGVSDGGLVIDLRDMRALEVDAEGRTAWAQTGLTAGEYTTAVAAHGLATGFGDTGSVGIGGITLGGGIGYLVRKHGLTIDDLLEAEVVTADGELLRVGPEQHPDLYWAIRGGGGNFGVATRFRFRLHPLERVVGGMLILPASAEVVASFLRLSAEAPEELSAIVNVMPAPPMPFVPEERHGETIVFALMAFAGPVDDGERVLAPFRALAEPIADLLRPIPYPELYPPEDDSYHPTAVGRTMLLDRVDDGAFEAIVDRVAASDAPMRVVQLRALGGAMARVPADATAFAHRSSAIMATAASFYEGDDDRPARVAWVDDLAATIRGDAEDRAYANFLGDEGPERVRAAYPGATWDRLREVKRRYDPTNLFRLNQNVPPAGG